MYLSIGTFQIPHCLFSDKYTGANAYSGMHYILVEEDSLIVHIFPAV